MYYYELFSHADRFSYRAHIISSATCVLILCTTLTFLSPFLLTYYTGDFWQNELLYSEQPYLDNTTKYIVLVNNNDMNTNRFFMSSYSILNNNLQNKLIAGSQIESTSDIDGDGLIDQFRISFDLSFSDASIGISSINIWLIFQYQLSVKQHINMETMALINIVPPSALTPADNKNLTVYGQLILVQNYAIESAGNESIYNQSIINTDSLSSLPDIDTILDDYFTRKYYTTYKTQYTYITPRTTYDTNLVTITIVVNIGRQAIRYVPGFWQEFKWGWIQYISVLLPFLIVFNRLKLFVFSNHLVRTSNPLPIHRHKA